MLALLLSVFWRGVYETGWHEVPSEISGNGRVRTGNGPAVRLLDFRRVSNNGLHLRRNVQGEGSSRIRSGGVIESYAFDAGMLLRREGILQRVKHTAHTPSIPTMLDVNVDVQ